MATSHAALKQVSPMSNCGATLLSGPRKAADHDIHEPAFQRSTLCPVNLQRWRHSVGGVALCPVAPPVRKVSSPASIKVVCFRRSAKRRKRENEAKMRLLVAEQRGKRAAEREELRKAELERRMAPPTARQPLAMRQLSELARVAVDHILATAEEQPVAQACRIFEETVSLTGWEGVIKELASRQRWDLSLDVFRWMEAHPMLRASDHLRSIVITIVGRAGRLDVGFDLLESVQQQEERTPAPACFIALARACARSGKIEQMLALFHKMYEAGLDPRADSYNDVFEELVVGRVSLLDTLRLFALMQQNNVSPKRITYTMLITACHVGGSIKDAYAIFEGLEAARWSPDIKAFNALLYICIVYRDFKEARRVFWRIRETKRMALNAKSYELVVRLCRETGWGWRELLGPGHWDDVIRLYGEMRVGNQWPTLTLYEELLQLVGTYNNHSLAAEYYRDLRGGARLEPSAAVYDALVNVDYRGEVQNPVRLLEGFRSLRCVPDVAFFQGMLAAYERAGAWQEAWLLLTAMPANQCSPTQEMVDTVGRMLTAADCELAEQVRGEMEGRRAEWEAAEAELRPSGGEAEGTRGEGEAGFWSRDGATPASAQEEASEQEVSPAEHEKLRGDHADLGEQHASSRQSIVVGNQVEQEDEHGRGALTAGPISSPLEAKRPNRTDLIAS